MRYTWNPPKKPSQSGIPPGHEKPVDAFERFLKDKPFRLIRDKNHVRFGENLRHFMKYGAKRRYVILPLFEVNIKWEEGETKALEAILERLEMTAVTPNA